MIGWASFKPVGKELEYLHDAFTSGWVSHGPYVDILEAKVSKLLGGGTALAVANGTAALVLAFQSLGVKPGDKVIVPAFSFQAAANVLLQMGAEPVFCDVAPLYWNQTKTNIEAVLDDTIKGVVVVHNYGAAADIRQISNLCKSKGIWLIEDAAEAWFTSYDGQYLGRFGDVATFSMHATKTIACGEGGVVLINQDSLVEKAKLCRSHGLDRSKVHYKHVLPGNNYRLSNLLAAIAVGQLEQFELLLEQQTRRTAKYREILSNTLGISFQRDLSLSKNELWADAIILDPAITGIDRDSLLERSNSLGLDMRPGFYTPANLQYYDEGQIQSTPVADYISKNIFVLPCSKSLTEIQMKKVSGIITKVTSEKMITNDPYSISPITSEDYKSMHHLQTFVDRLAASQKSFRYYSTRDISVVQNHITTLLVFYCNEPIGYGHLDQDGNTVWLGIAIMPGFTGKKLGHSIMNELLRRAEAQKIGRIDLFVDKNNLAAKSLYEQHGFRVDKSLSTNEAVRMHIQCTT